nr:RDD family protein [Pseudomonas fluorescens]
MAVVFFILLLKSFMIPLSVRFSSALSLTIFSGGEYFLTLLALVYFSFCDALRNGQSLGKCLFKISVVGFPYAPPCTVLQSALRKLPKALSSMLDGVFVFLVCIGDLVICWTEPFLSIQRKKTLSHLNNLRKEPGSDHAFRYLRDWYFYRGVFLLFARVRVFAEK